jgi:hypothetical protein
MIGDIKEFVVFMASYPPFHRQPYSAHLFIDRCMFGRHMEKESHGVLAADGGASR